MFVQLHTTYLSITFKYLIKLQYKDPIFNSADFFPKKVPLWKIEVFDGFGVVRVIVYFVGQGINMVTIENNHQEWSFWNCHFYSNKYDN